MKKLLFGFILSVISLPGLAATIVATVNNKPITDADITARVKLMSAQGQTSLNNRNQALENIVNDYVKLDYASTMGINPTDDEINAEFEKMGLSDLNSVEKSMAEFAIESNIAWQYVVGRTIIPTIETTDADIAAEKSALIAERGLPINVTIIRLLDIPESVAKKLTKPKSCADAKNMATKLGGDPQEITALQYELSDDVRGVISTLPEMQWSDVVDDTVLLVCKSEKAENYGDLDRIIKQNASFKTAMQRADQQLKQLRRKAIVIINDDNYKI